MKQMLRNAIVPAMAGLLLAACGGKPADEPAPEAAPNPPPKAAKGDATAEEVAREARGKLKCPPKIATPARAGGAPVDDILGVRPGLTYEEAASLVLCSHELLLVNEDKSRRISDFQTYGHAVRQGFVARFARERVQRTPQQIMRDMSDAAIARGSNRVVRDVLPGESRWSVGTIGVPGEERVVSLAREEWFAEGNNPTIASLGQALIQKYGTPTDMFPDFNGKGSLSLSWKYDRQGQPRSGLPCNGTVAPDGGVNYSQQCSLTVNAWILPLRGNPDIASHFDVGVTDENGGYERIVATEQALQALDAQRRAQEVRQAARNAATPEL